MDRFMQFLWYAAKKLAAGLVIVFLLVSAGFIGYDCANVYVIVHDGMTQRMAVITGTSTDPSVMNKYFTPAGMARDTMLNGAVPEGVIVKGYGYQANIKKLWVWPWKSKTHITVRDEVSRLELAPAEEDAVVPETLDLGSGDLKIDMVKENGRWYINGIERVRSQEDIEDEEARSNPTPTPDSSIDAEASTEPADSQ